MTERSRTDLSKIRGWLLVCVLILVPHGVGAILLLLLLDSTALGGTLGTATLVVTAAGNLSGILLVLSRNRIAPAFFTLYLPALLVLNLSDPDLLGTFNARLAAVGASGELAAAQLWALLAVNIVIVALMEGYWMRSERVRAVFGTRGLGLLRHLLQK